ncbi:unnamed protein product [Urochloa humidicola]
MAFKALGPEAHSDQQACSSGQCKVLLLPVLQQACYDLSNNLSFGLNSDVRNCSSVTEMFVGGRLRLRAVLLQLLAAGSSSPARCVRTTVTIVASLFIQS